MQLLKLRYLQLNRDLGYWVFIIAIGVFYLSKEISKDVLIHGIALAGIFIFFLFNYHTNRKDLNFIGKYFNHPKQNLLVTYNLLALPLSTALLINAYWQIVIVLHLTASLLVFIEVKVGEPPLLFISKYLPKNQFEWIAGIRKNFYILILLFLIALFLSPVKFFAALALFLLNSIFIGFYNFFEPLVMFNPEGLSSETFLKRKIEFFNKMVLSLNVPLLVINSIIHQDIAWFNACFLIGFLLVGSCFIYMKYENYKPNQELHFQIDSLLLFATPIIPFLLPLTFFLTQSHKRKAIQNLSNYTDDNK